MSAPPPIPITAWISAISTAALGVLGFLITAWQWRRAGFNPRLRSRIDARREAIEVLIRNTGRAGGIVDQLDVVGADDVIVDDVMYEGFDNGVFRPLALPAMASMRIIIQAAESRSFDGSVRVLVGVGKPKPKVVMPTETLPEVGIFGLTSVLPPGTST